MNNVAIARERELEDLFMTAIEMDTDHRGAFLARIGSDNSALCNELQGLLAADQQHTVNTLDLLSQASRRQCEPIVGQKLEGYEIKEPLAQGGMGTVYLAEHTLLGQKAAVKVIDPGYANDRDYVARFFREAKVASAIAHPGTVQVFGFGYHEDETAYLVMELIAGESLAERIKRVGRIPRGQALALVKHMACALAATHAQGIIHRDLKPANIMIVPDPGVEFSERIKILDFGIAKLAEEHDLTALTPLGVALGTPRYMAPEQCCDASAVDHRADLYALGCILFHMMCGSPPFPSQIYVEVMEAHRTASPPRPSELEPSIDPASEELLLRLLAKNPADRIQSARELADELDALMVRSRHESPGCSGTAAVANRHCSTIHYTLAACALMLIITLAIAGL